MVLLILNIALCIKLPMITYRCAQWTMQKAWLVWFNMISQQSGFLAWQLCSIATEIRWGFFYSFIVVSTNRSCILFHNCYGCVSVCPYQIGNRHYYDLIWHYFKFGDEPILFCLIDLEQSDKPKYSSTLYNWYPSRKFVSYWNKYKKQLSFPCPYIDCW